ncbi:MAG: protein-disulfide reductase DsbD family protein [Leadbetterella sp.]|nr:protein-disulfide reductase DsbD family protein [Leadbetterella sp.]
MHFKKVLILLFISISAFAQLEKPTTWKYKVLQEKVVVGDVVDVEFTATIQKDWYLYSSDFSPELGPTVTEFVFNKSKGFRAIGKIKPIHPKKKFDEVWGGDVTYFKETGKFVQKVMILEENPTISGKIIYQTCTDIDGKCVPGNEVFNIKTSTVLANKIEQSSDTLNSDTLTNQKEESAIELNEKEPTKTITKEPMKEAQSLWQFLLIAFGAGLASIFMPCIYPIMPMTVSFFTKQANGKSKAIFYGISIMAIFGVMGLITMAFGAPFLNFLSTHWLPNLIFFVIFILFGVSLLGAFEIVLPHETVNKIDRLSDKGGLIGIFFMALTLVVVSFSCTVPFVGSLLIAAAQGEVTRPIYGMLAFGLPFALVFSGLAMFPQMLKNLPKSGGWLNELKAVFGFLEFALALKFLSNIDLAYHWNLIHRNVFLVIWIVIAVIIGIYILGFIRLSKDDKIEKRGALRIFFSVIFLGLAAYMLPGVTGKSLSLLSGILPPMPISTQSTTTSELPTDKMRALPHELFGFYDFDDAQVYAKEINKPILIDFTGYACANCRKMEENVWSKPEVLKRLKEDFVIASLYVDDKKELPKEKQYTSSYDNELKTTVGDKNMDLEITKYNNNAQPYYIIVHPNGEKLLEPLGYSSEADFIKFLEKGKAGFK